jgi:pSer/pThr/pTyr-binding forkhead associated (FHA) protein
VRTFSRNGWADTDPGRDDDQRSSLGFLPAEDAPRLGPVLAKEDRTMANTAAVSAYDTPLEQSQSHVRSKGTGALTAQALLLVLTGPDAGCSFELGAETILGRDPTADAQVKHSTVSRHHARVWREEDGRYFVEDLGSANGTAISGRCIERSELKPHDRLQLGPHIELRFLVEG